MNYHSNMIIIPVHATISLHILPCHTTNWASLARYSSKSSVSLAITYTADGFYGNTGVMRTIHGHMGCTYYEVYHSTLACQTTSVAYYWRIPEHCRPGSPTGDPTTVLSPSLSPGEPRTLPSRISNGGPYNSALSVPESGGTQNISVQDLQRGTLQQCSLRP